jgi:putative membrane protein
MALPGDPRVYFAAERTLLAWIRTGITTTGLGFVVARFGLFLRYLEPHLGAAPGTAPDLRPGVSLVLGVAMVVVGATICLGATIQFRRFVGVLAPEELPPRWSPSFTGWSAYAFAAIGLLLAIYLML